MDRRTLVIYLRHRQTSSQPRLILAPGDRISNRLQKTYVATRVENQRPPLETWDFTRLIVVDLGYSLQTEQMSGTPVHSATGQTTARFGESCARFNLNSSVRQDMRNKPTERNNQT